MKRDGLALIVTEIPGLVYTTILPTNQGAGIFVVYGVLNGFLFNRGVF